MEHVDHFFIIGDELGGSVLAAVDQGVGTEQDIQRIGLGLHHGVKGRFLHIADVILLMKDGRIIHQGPASEIADLEAFYLEAFGEEGEHGGTVSL